MDRKTKMSGATVIIIAAAEAAAGVGEWVRSEVPLASVVGAGVATLSPKPSGRDGRGRERGRGRAGWLVTDQI